MPHHCFHVFAVYPWLGLLRTGVDEPLRVLDLCRTTPAVVVAVEGDGLQVALRPLLWNGQRLALGAWTTRPRRWRDDGSRCSTLPRPGEWVSLHWDVACDRLTPRGVAALDRATRQALRAWTRLPPRLRRSPSRERPDSPLYISRGPHRCCDPPNLIS